MKKEKHTKKSGTSNRWPFTAFMMAMVLSAVLSLASEGVLDGAGMTVALLILLLFIGLGILFDILGTAVMSADPKPFHSMAARKVPGAQSAIRLLRNAERVSSICNDVVGDICGVVSGSASATIAAQILRNFDMSWPQIVSLAMSALAAGLTVGGKAIGKSFAVNSCTTIVHTVGRILHTANQIFCKKKTTKKK